MSKAKNMPKSEISVQSDVEVSAKLPIWNQKYSEKTGDILQSAKIGVAAALLGKVLDSTKTISFEKKTIDVLNINAVADVSGIKITDPEKKMELRDAVLTVLNSLREKKHPKLDDFLAKWQGIYYSPNSNWFENNKPTKTFSEFEKKWNIEFSGDAKLVAESYGLDEFGNSNMTEASATNIYKKAKSLGIVMVEKKTKGRGREASKPSAEILALVDEL